MVRGILMIAAFLFISWIGSPLIAYATSMSLPAMLLLSYSILFVIAIIIYRDVLKREWQNLRQKQRPFRFAFALIRWALLTAAVVVATNYMLSLKFGVKVAPENQQVINNVVGKIPLIVSYLIICILGPFIEEMTFRQSFIGWAKDSQKILIAIMTVISIAVFDLMHVTKPIDFIVYLPVTVVITIYYLKHDRNPWTSIFLHSLYNTLGFVMMVFVLKS